MRVSPLKDGIERPRLAHVWIRAADDFYVEPHWCDQRLFEAESFDRSRLLLDPCCGSGRVTTAARQAGYRVQGQRHHRPQAVSDGSGPGPHPDR